MWVARSGRAVPSASGSCRRNGGSSTRRSMPASPAAALPIKLNLATVVACAVDATGADLRRQHLAARDPLGGDGNAEILLALPLSFLRCLPPASSVHHFNDLFTPVVIRGHHIDRPGQERLKC